MLTLEQRQNLFWQKVNKDGPIIVPSLGPCWLWLEAHDRDGYARFWTGQQSEPAFRVAWVWENGDIPEGKQLNHLCDYNPCIRTSHIELTTPYWNNSLRHRVFTEDEVRLIRRMLGEGTSRKVLAQEFGVSYMTIKNVQTRKNYTWVE